jgi:hypothetical protein
VNRYSSLLAKLEWNSPRNNICLYYSLEPSSWGRLFFTHNSGWHLQSGYCWKLRPELQEAMGEILERRFEKK